MFGDWFGHPLDNVHHVVNADADGDRFMLSFNDGETLTIWIPPSNSSEVDARVAVEGVPSNDLHMELAWPTSSVAYGSFADSMDELFKHREHAGARYCR